VDENFYDKEYTLEKIAGGKKLMSLKSKIGLALAN